MLRALLVLTTLLCSSAFGGQIYFQDFETGSGDADLSGSYSVISSGTGSVYSSLGMGNYILRTGSSTTLTVSGLTAGSQVDLSFTFIALDSWDGSGSPYGPDNFSVTINAATYYTGYFQNLENSLAIPLASGVPIYENSSNMSYVAGSYGMYAGYSAYPDAAYTFTFTGLTVAADGTLTIVFTGSGTQWQGSDAVDESVGLDNILVSTSAVPEPGTWLPLFSGLAAMAFFRRRK